MNIFAFRLNLGDAIFVIIASSWAAYSVLSRNKVLHQLSSISVLALIACMGTIVLFPISAFEMIYLNAFPKTINVWSSILGLVILSSLFPFTVYQHGVKTVEPSITSIWCPAFINPLR